MLQVLRFPLMQMGTVLSAAAQARVAVQRIESFLEKSKLDTRGPEKISTVFEEVVVEEEKMKMKKKKIVAIFDKAEFVWSPQQPKTKNKSESSTSTTSNEIKLDNIEEGISAAAADDTAPSTTTIGNDLFSLGPISIKVTSGDLIAVVGVVGCGKSMFISSMLGETHLLNGNAQVSSALSYVPQSAWIINASVRENITNFVNLTSLTECDVAPQSTFDEDLYNIILKACALDRDILEMPDKDQQVIGERGVTLSGGQKQRIALARASYSILMSKKLQSNAVESSNVPLPLLLLDDPLSALDAHTSRHIFDELLGSNGLLKDVSRILVTHAVQFLGQCSSVYLIHNSNLFNLGHFDTINDTINNIKVEDNDSNKDLIHVILQLSQTSQEGGNGEDDNSNLRNDSEDNILRLRSLSTSSAMSSISNKDEKTLTSAAKGKQLMTSENVEKGAVGSKVVFYMTSTFGTICTFFIPLGLAFVLERTTYVMTDWWLSVWTAASNSTPINGLNLQLPKAPDPDGQRWYAGWYAVFVLSAAFFVVCRLHGFATGLVKTAEKMFRRMLNSTVKAPMIFFETTPLGRITNRFSYDTEVVDSQLFSRINGVVASTSWLLGGMGVMIGTLPWMVAVLFPVLILYYFLYRFYRRACVEIQRLTAVTRSPIHSTFQEALQGADSIRAFNVEQRYVNKNRILVDKHSRAMVAMQVASRWLSIRLEMLGVIVVAGASLLAFFFKDVISPGMAGLAIMWGAQFSISLNFNTVNLTEAESLMTSVERMMEYIIDIKHEPNSITLEENKPQKDWPMNGEITFNKCVMSYREDLPPALCGLSVHIKGGQKIGIVGRTGAGKSTIATALFRLRELTEGTIEVDGVDISKLGLSDVRGRSNGMAIITQDPLVFSGPIRMTLDPFNNHTDDEIWNALDAVQMKSNILMLWSKHTKEREEEDDDENNEEINDYDQKNDSSSVAKNINENINNVALSLPIAEAGRNLSVGQRQLLCFARALLLRPKILILDEATASVDYQTDHLIQLTLRKLFHGTTMLVVAHRLQTIIDLDAVLVMEEGKCVEFDDAATLLSNPSSFFSGLVDATGTETSNMLRKQALDAAEGKKEEEEGGEREETK
jgi:ABC-type multidrug transport system fused ATPase/permease subunit